MDDDAGPSGQRRHKFISLLLTGAVIAALFVGLPVGLKHSNAQTAANVGAASSALSPVDATATRPPLSPWGADYLHPAILATILVLLALSGFFSGSETAFFSIHRLRLRAMREESSVSSRVVSTMMEHPGRLLTTILVGNMLINVLISILLGTRVEHTLSAFFGWPDPVPYVVAVTLVTLVLVFFGEILPKIFAVRVSESFARTVAFPLLSADRVLAPIRDGCIWLTNLLFRVTRFHSLRAAPFITDEEFRSVFSGPEAKGVIEKDDLDMIQGILESSDMHLKEVLTPRPDVVALPEDASVAEALQLLREHEYSRVPVYEDDLDHVKGILVAKDMLPSLRKGELDRKVKKIIRPAHYVPQTMTIHQFVKEAQRRRSHLAIVVDEYGGTAGIVTLEDAMEEVVGDILDEQDQEEQEYVQLDASTYRVEGSMQLDELSSLINVPVQDEEHETVAGFIMAKSDKIPEIGDTVEFSGVSFTVEQCDGRRVEWIRVHVHEPAASDTGESPS